MFCNQSYACRPFKLPQLLTLRFRSCLARQMAISFQSVPFRREYARRARSQMRSRKDSGGGGGFSRARGCLGRLLSPDIGHKVHFNSRTLREIRPTDRPTDRLVNRAPCVLGTYRGKRRRGRGCTIRRARSWDNQTCKNGT